MSDPSTHTPPPPAADESGNGSGNYGNDNSSHIPIKPTPELEKCQVTGIVREGTRIRLNYELRAHDGQPNTKVLSFELSPKGLFETLEQFDKAARGTWGPNRTTRLSDDLIERTKVALSSDPYIRRKLQFYKRDTGDVASQDQDSSRSPDIGDNFDENIAKNIEQEQQEQEEVYATAISDLDYDEYLNKLRPEEQPVLSVSSAIRKNPGRMVVSGVIDLVKKPIKLHTQLVFSCNNVKCSRHNDPEYKLLDTPIYSFEDMPIAFDNEYDKSGKLVKTSLQIYQDLIICPECKHQRQVRFDTRRYENAKVIEIKNLSTSKLVAANTTLNLEHIRAFVTGRHTLSVGLGEEVEVIGDMYIVSQVWTSSRFGTRNISSGGIGDPILYIRKMKYTKRQREINITERDEVNFERFLSYPDYVKRVVSLVASHIHGHEDEKLSGLLMILGAAPKQRQNWYSRNWINGLFVGDIGTAKTELMRSIIALVPGSQEVNAKHSTGKGIVAIAEREGDGGALLRTGAIALANGRICGIDEVGTFLFEEQEQLLQIMDKGYFDFRKLGINQRVYAKTPLILTANPMGKGGKWNSPDGISMDEIPLKGQLLDRSDLIHIFRLPRTAQEIRDFNMNKHKLAKKYFRRNNDGLFDSIYLRKLLYWLKNNSELDNIVFESVELEDRLNQFRTEMDIKLADNGFMSGRNWDSIFRVASAIARLMCKRKIDNEVVEHTIQFLRRRYEDFGMQMKEFVENKDLAYSEIIKVVRDRYDNRGWIQGIQQDQIDEIVTVPFNEAAQIASARNDRVAYYLGKNFKDPNNRPVRNLKELFREERQCDGGRVRAISKSKYSELRLRWEPDSNSDGDINSGYSSQQA